MAKMFHRHPDSLVYIRDDQTTLYGDTNENFEWDFEVTLPDLPPGADEEIYVQGVRHPYESRTGMVGAGPMPYPFGDDAIANVNKGVARQKARQPPPPPVMPRAEPVPLEDIPEPLRDWVKRKREWEKTEERRIADMRRNRS